LLWCCCDAIVAGGAWFRFGADQVSGYFDPFARAGTGYTIELAARKRVIYQGRDWVSASGYRRGGGRFRSTGDEKRFGPMSVVVERGSARCPHCVAVADYTFVESELDMVRYEVHCHSCGEVYSEESSLAPAMPLERILPVPPLPPVAAPASWRRHLTSFGRVAERLRARVRAGATGAADMPNPGEYGANG
jgi:hypothetical protein